MLLSERLTKDSFLLDAAYLHGSVEKEIAKLAEQAAEDVENARDDIRRESDGAVVSGETG